MKERFILCISIVIFCFFDAFAQCDCNTALSADLLDVSTEYNETQFREFLYQYFKASKKERKRLKKSYSNSFGLSTVIKKLPIEFSSDNRSGSDINAFYAFEQEVLKNKYVSNEIIESITTKYLGDNQLKAYLACLKSNCGTANGVTTEYGGDEFDVFFVRLIFNNSISDARIQLGADVQYAGCTPVYGLTMKKGVELKNGQDLVQYFKRDRADKVASVNVKFSNGLSALPVVLKKKNKKSSQPIGTIVASALTFSEFRSQFTDKAFKKEESIWAPCDGRKVVGSVYSSKYQKDFVPDLRGQFLRGNFSMGGPSELEQNTPNGKNPRDGETHKNGYIYQSEMTKEHGHSGWVGTYSNGNPDGSRDRRGPLHAPGGADRYPVVPININKVGGSETRPKNMYVYYYIRIN